MARSRLQDAHLEYVQVGGLLVVKAPYCSVKVGNIDILVADNVLQRRNQSIKRIDWQEQLPPPSNGDMIFVWHDDQSILFIDKKRAFSDGRSGVGDTCHLTFIRMHN